MRDPHEPVPDRPRSTIVVDAAPDPRRTVRVRSRRPGRHERIRLIEFVWTGRTGLQPVLFLERERLQ